MLGMGPKLKALRRQKMKKSSLVLLSLVLAGAAFAEDLLKPVEHPVRPVGINLVTPVQMPSADATIDGLRLNLIYGENFGVNGLDLGLFGCSRANASGLALDLFAARYDFDFTGGLFAGLGMAVLGNGTGCELSVIANYNRGSFTGLQLALLNNNGLFEGVQVGAVNYNKGASKGFQVGLYNNNLNEYHGWSIGGINCADRFNGVQIGLVNVVTTTGRGVQIGVFNSSVSYAGVQIGLLNLIGNAEFPVLPFLNAQF